MKDYKTAQKQVKQVAAARLGELHSYLSIAGLSADRIEQAMRLFDAYMHSNAPLLTMLKQDAAVRDAEYAERMTEIAARGAERIAEYEEIKARIKAEDERVYDPPCSFEVTIANRILLPFTVTAPSAVEAGKKALEMLAAMTTEQWLAKIASCGWEDDDSVDVISAEKD